MYSFQPVINSTVTANMVFNKTSTKFGQWADVRANTVYGLGFSSDTLLNKFAEHFEDIRSVHDFFLLFFTACLPLSVIRSDSEKIPRCCIFLVYLVSLRLCM